MRGGRYGVVERNEALSPRAVYRLGSATRKRGGPIHIAFLLSAIAIAYTDRLLNSTATGSHRAHSREEGV